jgi:hypothetical protein
MNIAAGLNYALVSLPERNFILTPAVRFEAPVGGREVYSGYGDGVFIPSISSAWGLGDFHALASLGGQVPFDTGKQSTQLFYNLHLDYALFSHFVPLVGLNGYHWMDSGNGSLPVETDLGTVSLRTAEQPSGAGASRGRTS